MIIDEKDLLCEKHGLDYRIICDECQEKYLLFQTILEETIASQGQGIGEPEGSPPQKTG